MSFTSLNEQQKKAAEAPQKPLLIIAGAGTGKTRTLTSRLAYLIKTGVKPEHICALTFTNKAAKEMQERVQQLLGGSENFRGTFIGTFHSLGARILRKEALLICRQPNFAIYDDSDSVQVVKKALARSKLKTNKISTSIFLNKISRLKNKIISLSALKTSRRPEDVSLLAIYDLYEKELEANNAFDFDDLIEKVVAVFKAHPERLKRYQARFTHILIDEYQDLNNVQYELIRLIAGKAGNLSVVGDDQQTIYSWRGSNYQIFLDFEKDWPEAQMVILEQNYRSTSTIIEAAGELIKHNKSQRPKRLTTQNPQGKPILITEFPSDDDEAIWIANTIATKLHGAAKQESIGILYRTNAQSRALEQALLERGIPYRIYGGLQFYERKEVKDAVAALRYAANPYDQISKERLEKNLSKRRFSEFQKGLYEKTDPSASDVIRLFLESFEYFEYLQKNFVNAIERQENITQLVHFASDFISLQEFLEKVSLLQSTDTASVQRGGSQAVTMMTIHMAKGLEFDTVFIAGCAEGLLPHSRSIETPDELEEERRLMYVAITRARKELSLSFYDIPSRFLFEIPQEYVQFQSSTSGENQLVDDEERYITLD